MGGCRSQHLEISRDDPGERCGRAVSQRRVIEQFAQQRGEHRRRGETPLSNRIREQLPVGEKNNLRRVADAGRKVIG